MAEPGVLEKRKIDALLKNAYCSGGELFFIDEHWYRPVWYCKLFKKKVALLEKRRCEIYARSILHEVLEEYRIKMLKANKIVGEVKINIQFMPIFSIGGNNFCSGEVMITENVINSCNSISHSTFCIPISSSGLKDFQQNFIAEIDRVTSIDHRSYCVNEFNWFAYIDA